MAEYISHKHSFKRLTRINRINMKTIIISCLALAAVAFAFPNEDKYTTRYDDIDIDEILSNPKVIEGYVNCALGLGKCTPEGKTLKEHIIDALETKCSKCNEKQKEATRKVIKHLINHEPAHWKNLCEKYDPTEKYVKEYEAELRDIKN